MRTGARLWPRRHSRSESRFNTRFSTQLLGKATQNLKQFEVTTKSTLHHTMKGRINISDKKARPDKCQPGSLAERQVARSASLRTFDVKNLSFRNPFGTALPSVFGRAAPCQTPGEPRHLIHLPAPVNDNLAFLPFNSHHRHSQTHLGVW